MEKILYLFDQFAIYGDIASYVLVFVLLLISGIGVPLPEDITLVTAGILVGQGYADIHIMLLVTMLGVLIGDSSMYLLGYVKGVKILRVKWIKKILTAKRIGVMRRSFQQNATSFLFIARFLPGLRAAIYLFAGLTHKVSYRKFIFIDFLASIISVPAWVYLGYFFGSNLHHLKVLMHKIGFGVSIVAVVGLVILIFAIKKSNLTKKLSSKIGIRNIEVSDEIADVNDIETVIDSERNVSIQQHKHQKENRQVRKLLPRKDKTATNLSDTNKPDRETNNTPQ